MPIQNFRDFLAFLESIEERVPCVLKRREMENILDLMGASPLFAAQVHFFAPREFGQIWERSLEHAQEQWPLSTLFLDGVESMYLQRQREETLSWLTRGRALSLSDDESSLEDGGSESSDSESEEEDSPEPLDYSNKIHIILTSWANNALTHGAISSLEHQDIGKFLPILCRFYEKAQDGSNATVYGPDRAAATLIAMVEPFTILAWAEEGSEVESSRRKMKVLARILKASRASSKPHEIPSHIMGWLQHGLIEDLASARLKEIAADPMDKGSLTQKFAFRIMNAFLKDDAELLYAVYQNTVRQDYGVVDLPYVQIDDEQEEEAWTVISQDDDEPAKEKSLSVPLTALSTKVGFSSSKDILAEMAEWTGLEQDFLESVFLCSQSVYKPSQLFKALELFEEQGRIVSRSLSNREGLLEKLRVLSEGILHPDRDTFDELEEIDGLFLPLHKDWAFAFESRIAGLRLLRRRQFAESEGSVGFPCLREQLLVFGSERQLHSKISTIGAYPEFKALVLSYAVTHSMKDLLQALILSNLEWYHSTEHFAKSRRMFKGASFFSDSLKGQLMRIAMENEDLSTLQFLMELEPSRKEQSVLASRLLLHASHTGDLELLQVLVEEFGANVDHQSANGWAPINIAAYYGYWDYFKALVHYSADIFVAQQTVGSIFAKVTDFELAKTLYSYYPCTSLYTLCMQIHSQNTILYGILSPWVFKGVHDDILGSRTRLEQEIIKAFSAGNCAICSQYPRSVITAIATEYDYKESDVQRLYLQSKQGNSDIVRPVAPILRFSETKVSESLQNTCDLESLGAEKKSDCKSATLCF